MGCHFLLQGIFPTQGLNLSQPALAGGFFTAEVPGKPPWTYQFSSVTQSCPTLCDHMDCSRLGSSVPEISQARILEWVVISFFRGSSRPRDQTQISCIAGRFFTV